MNTILDTSVIIDNPNNLFAYKDVIIPYFVLEELDNLKDSRNIGNKARLATRLILDHNIPCRDIRASADMVDNKLIQLSRRGYKIITSDLLLYLKGQTATGNVFLHQRPNMELYEGVKDMDIPPELYTDLFDNKGLKVEMDLYENQFIDDGNNMIARYKNGRLKKIKWYKELDGVGMLNRRQMMATNLLFDPDVTVVSLIGRAGSGKTSLAINTAIQQVKNGLYDKIILARPKIQKGLKEEKLGYLKGDKEEKLADYVQPFFDNIKIQSYIDYEIESLSLIQGRNIDNSLFLITESQNIAPEDMDCLIERIGKNAKLILEGDINQVNRGGLTPEWNGLSFVANILKDEPLTGSILLTEVERSETAKLGEKLRKNLR